MLEYKQKNGKVLKGFSQVDLDKLNTNIKRLTWVFGSALFILIGTLFWILWQVKKYKIISLMIQALRQVG